MVSQHSEDGMTLNGLPPIAAEGDLLEQGPLGTSPPVGDYDAYMAHVRLLADPVLAEVSEGLKYIVPSAREMAYIMRLLPLATLQLTGEAGWWEIDLDQAMARRRLLLNALANWDTLAPVDQDRLPLTKREATQELGQTDVRIRELRQRIAVYKARGHWWSAKPLLEYMERPQEDRQGYAYDHLLPPLMRDVKQAMYAAMPAGIGYANRQAIGSNQMMDFFQPSNMQKAAAMRNGVRVPRLRQPKGGRDAV